MYVLEVSICEHDHHIQHKNLIRIYQSSCLSQVDFCLAVGRQEFEWGRYLKEQDAEAAPRSSFKKVQKIQHTGMHTTLTYFTG